MTRNIPIVCPDSVRLALHGQQFIESCEPYVWAIARTMVKSLFLSGHQYVILDACNGTRVRRDEWKSPEWNRHFWLVQTSPEECIRRARESGMDNIIPVIERMTKKWEWPSTEEGFGTTIYPIGGRSNADPW